jgi:hypothetical protein
MIGLISSLEAIASGRMYPVAISTVWSQMSCWRDMKPVSITDEAVARISVQLEITSEEVVPPVWRS